MNPPTENSTRHFPDVATVDRIAGHPDPVTRNLQITQSYSELSAAIAETVGPVSNWCTYAMWASKQAGRTIRQQDLVRTFEDRLGKSPEGAAVVDELVRGLGRRARGKSPSEIECIVRRSLSPQGAFDRASAAIARGNLKVFAEIGREFSFFLETFRHHREADPAAIDSFCDRLSPGPPPDGQDSLRTAFRSLYLARFENDPKARAELLLWTNLEIGFHEQTRLQPEIEAGLGAPVVDARETRREVLAELFPETGLLDPFFGLYLRWTLPIDRFWGKLTGLARRKARSATTELLMVLDLPGGESLRLGSDLKGHYPESVRRIRDPGLIALIARLDPEPGTLRGSGADDWADFPQRMQYIAEFFRAYQERESLQSPPFTPEQVQAIVRGKIPSGSL